MIFQIRASNEDSETVAEIIVSEPNYAWDAFASMLDDNKIAFVSIKYWYNHGIMRSNYAVDVKRRRAWLFDGESTPTILKGIEHYLMEAK